MNKPPAKVTIPKDWNADQAKLVLEFLDDIIAAIWHVHEEAVLEKPSESNAPTPNSDFPF